MKKGKTFLNVLFIFFFFNVSYADYDWHLFGLEEYHIYCIIVDKSKRLIAGTDKGLYIYNENEEAWIAIPLNGNVLKLPVNDIVLAAKDHIVVTIGKNSDSDGIYLGTPVKGAPYYQLTLIDYMDSPQSLAMRGMNADTLYAGGLNRIAMSILTNSQPVNYGKLTDIKTPENCFGESSPVCAALYYYQYDSNRGLIAGGYDSGTVPIKGNLLRQASDDSLYIVRNIAVSALTEGTINSLSRIAGTLDSGVFVLPYASSEIIIASPNDEPIRNLYRVITLVNTDQIYAVVNSGIYGWFNNDWFKIGNLKKTPNAITYKRHIDSVSNLYAGTSEGVFVYDTITSPINNNPKLTNSIDNFTIRNNTSGSIRVDFSIQKTAKVTIVILNLVGKTIFSFENRYYSRGRHTIMLNKNSWNDKCSYGVYVFKLSIDRKCIYKKHMFIRR